jgi:hypothetical protein
VIGWLNRHTGHMWLYVNGMVHGLVIAVLMSQCASCSQPLEMALGSGTRIVRCGVRAHVELRPAFVGRAAIGRGAQLGDATIYARVQIGHADALLRATTRDRRCVVRGVARVLIATLARGGNGNVGGRSIRRDRCVVASVVEVATAEHESQKHESHADHGKHPRSSLQTDSVRSRIPDNFPPDTRCTNKQQRKPCAF